MLSKVSDRTRNWCMYMDNYSLYLNHRQEASSVLPMTAATYGSRV